MMKKIMGSPKTYAHKRRNTGLKQHNTGKSWPDILTYAALAILALAAFICTLKSTSLLGPGMSPDAVCYVAAAESLLQGNGYLDFDRDPYTHWPPLFPTLMAALGLVGIEPLQAARFVNGAAFALIVLIAGLLFKKRINSRLLVVIGSAVVMLSTILLKISVYAWSEPVFLVFTILFVLTLSRFLENEKIKWLILAAICSALACLQRYIGVTVIATGGVLIFFFMTQTKWLKRIKYCIIYGVIACTPIGLWALRCRLTPQTGVDYRFEIEWNIHTKVAEMLDLMTPWFVPEKVPPGARLVIVGVFTAILIAAVVVKRRKFGKEQVENKTLVKVAITFVAVYCTAVTAARILVGIWATKRISSPIYVLIILLTLIGLDALSTLIGAALRKKWAGYLLIAALCVLWLFSYRVPLFKQHVRRYEQYGIPGLNSAGWHRSPLINWLRENPLKGPVFSNEPHAVFFLSKHQTRISPRKNIKIETFIEYLDPQGTNYLIWFKRHWRDYLYDLKELSSMFRFGLVEEMPDGLVLTIRLRDNPQN
ncbi:MAG: phospholipid carrier-dependent glycosyltransferase [Sedimentisphaerales bacterium]|jgi:hypothetical protein|nr:phospholipid carrier-dependent glycosyltransferase [Sedimentisphaerales bacterium]